MPTERGHHSWCALTDDNHRGACEAVAENKIIHREARPKAASPVPAVEDRERLDRAIREHFWIIDGENVRIDMTVEDFTARVGAVLAGVSPVGEVPWWVPVEGDREPFWNRRWALFEDEDHRFCIVTQDDAAEYVVWPEMGEQDVRRVIDAHNTVLNAAQAGVSQPKTEEENR